MTMPEEPEKQNECPRNGLREFSRLLLKILLWTIGIVVVLPVLAGLFLPPLGQPSEKGYYTDCSSKLILLEKNIYWLTKVDKEREKPENWSACDLIRDDLSQYEGENRRMAELNLSCSKDHQAYLIFPVSAYIGLYEESVQPPVPVAMCRPDAHRRRKGGFYFPKEYGAMVLYSDGHVERVSREEAFCNSFLPHTYKNLFHY